MHCTRRKSSQTPASMRCSPRPSDTGYAGSPAANATERRRSRPPTTLGKQPDRTHRLSTFRRPQRPTLIETTKANMSKPDIPAEPGVAA